MAKEVYMPKMSDHMQEGTILSWLVAEGEQVSERQPILEIETDKAVGEVEAPASGLLTGIREGAGEGAIVPVGEVIAFITQPGESPPQLAPIGQAQEAAPPPPPEDAAPDPPAPPPAEPGPILASPVARRVAKKLGVDLSKVTGTGPRGRIKESDVVAFIENQSGTEPPEAEDTWHDLSTIQRITGERMALSKSTVPHFVLSMEVDMSEAVRWREANVPRILNETGHSVSFTALIVKAVAAALKKHPLANAEYVDGRVRAYGAVHVGVAASTAAGLVVPVIRSADTKTVANLAGELAAIQRKSTTGRFTPEDLTGGTFTISNLGMYAVDSFSAIINTPQSAILAVGRIVRRPVCLGDADIGVRPMMDLTLSVDHRVLDGVQGAQFLSEVRDLLEDPRALLG
jgi:pyruvate dehydrogenase E2 component (dihydrolipoamide acetyltransferase)